LDISRRRNTTPQFAICINANDQDLLTPLKIYPVLPDKSAEEINYVRVIDDEGEDPRACLKTSVCCHSEPRKWRRISVLRPFALLRVTYLGGFEMTSRVILLEDGETVHNAFFDRSFKEKEK
jgi:hypothetical protein